MLNHALIVLNRALIVLSHALFVPNRALLVLNHALIVLNHALAPRKAIFFLALLKKVSGCISAACLPFIYH